MELKQFTDSKDSYLMQAKEVANKITEGKINLQVDIAKIKDLDAIIEQIRNLKMKNLINDDVAWNLSVLYGTVLGEMIIKEHGYHWNLNEEEMPVVETDRNDQMSPITKIYKILTSEEGDEGSPSSFYNGYQALQKYYYEMSDEEKAKITKHIGPGNEPV